MKDPIEFEEGIPIPLARNRVSTQFAHMRVGDSFVGGINEGSALQRYCERHGWRYTRRVLEGKDHVWRFWRIE